MWNQRRRRLSSIINTHPSHTPPPPLIPRGLSVPHPIFLNLLSTPTPPLPPFLNSPVIPLSAKREKRRMLGGIDFFSGRFSQCGASLSFRVLRTVSGIDTAASVRPLFTQSEKGKNRHLRRPVGDAIGRRGGKLSNPIDWKLAVWGR